jgi:hypothetical protein
VVKGVTHTLETKIEHVGTVKLSGGMLRIDVKIIQAAIARSDVSRLVDEQARVTVWDMTPVWAGSGEPVEAGQAWINGSGRAVMYQIQGRRYISPLSHLRATITGSRKFANISTINWEPFTQGATAQVTPQGVPA